MPTHQAPVPHRQSQACQAGTPQLGGFSPTPRSQPDRPTQAWGKPGEKGSAAFGMPGGHPLIRTADLQRINGAVSCWNRLIPPRRQPSAERLPAPFTSSLALIGTQVKAPILELPKLGQGYRHRLTRRSVPAPLQAPLEPLRGEHKADLPMASIAFEPHP